MDEFILDNKEYLDDVIRVAELDLPWNKMIGKNLIITGATGMMGRFLIDVIMYRNKNKDMNCHVTALGRSETKLYNMFKEYVDDSMLTTVEHDLNQSYEKGQLGYPDYVIHLPQRSIFSLLLQLGLCRHSSSGCRCLVPVVGPLLPVHEASAVRLHRLQAW